MKYIEENFKNSPQIRIGNDELNILTPLMLELTTNELVQCINIIPRYKINENNKYYEIYIHIIISNENESQNFNKLKNNVLKTQYDISNQNFHNGYRFNVFGINHFNEEELFKEDYLKELASGYIIFDRYNYFSNLQEHLKEHNHINNLATIENIDDLHKKKLIKGTN